MIRPDQRNWLTLALLGLMVLFLPVVVLAITLEVLILFGDIDLADLSPLELFELYVVELVVLAAFAYLVYRVTLYTVRHELPRVLTDREAEERVIDGDDTDE